MIELEIMTIGFKKEDYKAIEEIGGTFLVDCR